MMKTKPLIQGVIIGSIIGAALSIITAPKSGQQLRQDVSTNGARYKNLLKDVTKESGSVKQAVTALTNEAKNNIPIIINDFKDSISTFKKDIEPETKNLQQEIEGLQKSFTEIEQKISSFKKKDEKPTK